MAQQVTVASPRSDVEPPHAGRAQAWWQSLTSFRAGWERHPADAARLVIALAVGGVLLLMAAFASETVKGTSEDLIDLVDRLGTGVVRAIIGMFQLLTIGVTLTVAGVLMYRRRWGTLLVLVVAATGAAVAVALLGTWLSDAVPQATVDRNATDSFVTGAAFPSLAFLAGASAAVTVGAPSLSHSWRLMTWAAIGSLIVSRIITSTVTPVHAAMAVAVGSAVGSLTLLVFGAPVRRARIHDLSKALSSFGVDTFAVEPAEVGATHSSTFRAAGKDDPLFVKVIGRDERDEELLFRTLRAIRVKGIEDRVPYASASEAVHAEAMSLALAERAGVRAPELVTVGSSREGWAFVVATELAGTRLDDLAADDISDDLLDDLWRQVALLQARRTAHRWLSTHHVMATPSGGACLLDFRWAVHGVDEGTLGADVGELLTSLSLAVGPERALATAVAALSREQLARALPYLQPRALSADTQRQLRHQPDLLDELRSRLQDATGVEEYELADLQRVTAWGALLVFGTGVLVLFLLALVANLGNIIDAFEEAEWWWCVAVLVLAAATYPSGALSLMGAVSRQLPFVLTTVVMLGQSFLNRFTPANAGGMALRVRYVQLQGVDLTTSAAAVGLTSAASGVMQVVLLVSCFVWAGQTDELSYDLPKFDLVALVVAVLAAAAFVTWFTAWGRRVVKPLLYTTVGKVWKQIVEIARNPVKMILLFGGAGASKLLTILAFWASMQAFGVEESIPRTAVLYLVATTIAAAVPTPGGVGAIEAALIAGLTGIGVDPGVAFSIVIIFRVGTYWLPVPFGYLAYSYVQRVKAV